MANAVGSDSNPAFTVNPEAIEFLKSVPQPIAICGVAGMYRTGKSYLLNRVILNKGTGFGVGPTINPCTKVLKLFLDILETFPPKEGRFKNSNLVENKRLII
jgi:hypothetical protein